LGNLAEHKTLNDKILWYDSLSTCYGYRLQSDGERNAFYVEVEEVTGAKNGEIGDAIRWASRFGLKSNKEYSRIGTDDVIKWVFAMRDRAKARRRNVSDSERFKAEWIVKLNDGWDVSIMESEAIFIQDLDEEGVRAVIADVMEVTGSNDRMEIGREIMRECEL
jgi:hypothetical protein